MRSFHFLFIVLSFNLVAYRTMLHTAVPVMHNFHVVINHLVPAEHQRGRGVKMKEIE